MSTKTTSKTEQQVAAASYILNFYQDVGALTNAFAHYSNILAQFGATAEGDLNEVHRNALNQNVQSVRYHIETCYIVYRTLSDKLEVSVEDVDVIEQAYTESLKDYIMKKDRVKDFVLWMNKVLADKVMTSLMETSNDMIDKVYGGGE